MSHVTYTVCYYTFAPFESTPTMLIALQVIIILTCLVIGAHRGGMALGLIAGVGLLILVFAFRLEPGSPPVSVILTILAVIGCAATLQQSGGLDVMMQFAEKILRRHPEQITILGPLTTWTLTVLCGTGHVVYTMLPIIADISIKKNIRPERPMAASSVAAQMAVTASPVSVATVSVVSIIADNTDKDWSVPQILMISLPASLCGVLMSALWSMRRGKELDDDPEFQERLKNPDFKAAVYAGSESLIGKRFEPGAYRATGIFLGAIAVVVLLGAFPILRPFFPTGDEGALEPLSMNLVIQMVMLAAGAIILMTCNVNASKIANTTVFKSGATAMFSIFGVAWMTLRPWSAPTWSPWSTPCRGSWPSTCGCTPLSCSSLANWSTPRRPASWWWRPWPSNSAWTRWSLSVSLAPPTATSFCRPTPRTWRPLASTPRGPLTLAST